MVDLLLRAASDAVVSVYGSIAPPCHGASFRNDATFRGEPARMIAAGAARMQIRTAARKARQVRSDARPSREAESASTLSSGHETAPLARPSSSAGAKHPGSDGLGPQNA